MTETERRRFQRIILSRPVSLVVDGRTYTGRLLDISLRGALIETDEAPSILSPGAQGTADISLGDDAEFMIRIQATIRHMDRNQIGLHVDSLNLDDAARLRRLVELNIGDSKLLQRELEELVAE